MNKFRTDIAVEDMNLGFVYDIDKQINGMVFKKLNVDETLSKKIVTGILKEELGFKGVVTTDEITMGGIISEFEVNKLIPVSANNAILLETKPI